MIQSFQDCLMRFWHSVDGPKGLEWRHWQKGALRRPPSRNSL
jgi:hypothetical protein